MSTFARWCAVTLITLSVVVALAASGRRPVRTIAVTRDGLITIGVPLQPTRELVEVSRAPYRVRGHDHRSPSPFFASPAIAGMTMRARVMNAARPPVSANARSAVLTLSATGPPARS